ncbi:type II toxin-antitoxin system RelE/ParE family toxin [Frankia sp. Cas3]|uniref:type II toxin-antitoxin system RelE family toxin n=1 Tax=Frankia sp. Cas3 TaxID=3073926 RepID=UPI002AD29C27|nr:type II toxin-antitoxin system RelE/ParE family toxin [Frankia sp. Cas3]
MNDPYEVRWSRSARRAVAEELPEPVAAAVLELVTGPMRAEPRRMGKPLHAPFAGLWSARRATYRVVYSIDEDKRLVTVEMVRHRQDFYRT